MIKFSDFKRNNQRTSFAIFMYQNLHISIRGIRNVSIYLVIADLCCILNKFRSTWKFYVCLHVNKQDIEVYVDNFTKLAYAYI